MMGWLLRVLQHQVTFAAAGILHLLRGGTLQSPNLTTQELGVECLVHA